MTGKRVVGRHTPGPWFAGESADGEYLVWAESDPNAAIAAVLPGPCADANASVFAESLGMLEALQQIAEGNLGDAAWQANYDAIRAVASAAVARALGQQPNAGLRSCNPT